MKKPKKDPVREDRIHNEAIADANGPEEQVMGWYYYLEDKIRFPFQAKCIAAKVVSPLRKGSSRPAELHRQPLTEPSVRLSPHSAPIRQTHQSSRSANVQRYPRIPSPAVLENDSLGLCGV